MASPIATHEAAHAVVALAVGGEVDRVVLRATSGGFTDWLPPDRMPRRDRAAVILAGAVAEYLHGIPRDWAGVLRVDGAKLTAMKLTTDEWCAAWERAESILTTHRLVLLDLAAELDVRGVLHEDDVLRVVRGRVRRAA